MKINGIGSSYMSNIIQINYGQTQRISRLWTRVRAPQMKFHPRQLSGQPCQVRRPALMTALSESQDQGS